MSSLNLHWVATTLLLLWRADAFSQTSSPDYSYSSPSYQSSQSVDYYQSDYHAESSAHHYAPSSYQSTQTIDYSQSDYNSYSPIATQYEPSLEKKVTQPFRLLSWNILAQCYAPPSRHPCSLPEHLEWSFRKTRIVDTLMPQNYLPDIVCLQEVQVDLWETDLKPALERAAVSSHDGGRKLRAQSAHYHRYLEQLQRATQAQDQQDEEYGYTSLLQKVKKKPIANAILIRNGFAKCLKVESRSRAVIAVLELKNGRRIIVANVHLQAGSQEYHHMQRFYQINSLMKRIDNFIRQYSTDTTIPSVILVGDFNTTPDNPLYHLLRYGTLPPDYSHVEDLQKFESMPHLPVSDAYRDCLPPQGVQASTYTSGHVIDYLWTSRMVVHETWQSHSNGGLDVNGMFLQGKRYPNDDTPSDHLPIGAILEVPL